MRQRFGRALYAVALVTVLGGCAGAPKHEAAGGAAPSGRGAAPAGAAPGGAASIGPRDPCDLATPGDITAALGLPAETPQVDDRGMLTACTVWSQGHERYLVILLPPGNLEDPRPGIDWTRPRFDSRCAGKHAHNVAGVGDAACFVVDKVSGELNVLKGPFAVSCYLSFDNPAQRPAEDVLLATLRTLATAIMSRL